MQNITPGHDLIFTFFEVLGQNKHLLILFKGIFCQSLLHAHITLTDCHILVSQLLKGVIMIHHVLIKDCHYIKKNVLWKAM